MYEKLLRSKSGSNSEEEQENFTSLANQLGCTDVPWLPRTSAASVYNVYTV